jgi:capsular polysaccharide biosynthesis protein
MAYRTTVLYKKLIRFLFRRMSVVLVTDFKTGCERNSLSFTLVAENKQIYIKSPTVFGADIQFEQGMAKLPDIYLATIKNAIVFGGSDLVLTKNRLALYDELALSEKNHYGYKSPVTRYFYQDKVILDYFKEHKKLPETGIHFCKDHSYNYFHWVIEAIPRLWIVDQFPELDNLPLIVDDGLYPQQLEILQKFNTKKRKLVFVKRRGAYRIKNLVYPSSLSFMHDNTDHQVLYDKDAVISPLAIHYLRDKLLNDSSLSLRPRRKIFVSRKSLPTRKFQANRGLLNSDEIENLFLEQGFEVIHPEFLSFANQLRIFSEAKIIAGPIGAAMTNLIFAPQGCKVFMFSHYRPQVNYYFFNQLADYSGVQLSYILGQEVIKDVDYKIHNPFSLDKTKITQVIGEL